MMKFLIQAIDRKVKHDFSFVLLQSIDYYNWSSSKENIKFKFFNTKVKQSEFNFKKAHRSYVPVGSVEFVSAFLQHFYNLTPKPINVPVELWHHPSWNFTKRTIINGNHLLLENCAGKFFVKSNDKIKGFGKIIECRDTGNQGTLYSEPIPEGNYQTSEYVNGINSEWRAFVYKNKLAGLQNYSGDFTRFPSIVKIEAMIDAYKSAPIAYTLDVGVCDEVCDDEHGFHLYNETIVIECHDFFSCGLYGFSDLNIYPLMLHRWFYDYVNNIKHGNS